MVLAPLGCGSRSLVAPPRGVLDGPVEGVAG
jgi:hypothetical protein